MTVVEAYAGKKNINPPGVGVSGFPPEKAILSWADKVSMFSVSRIFFFFLFIFLFFIFYFLK